MTDPKQRLDSLFRGNDSPFLVTLAEAGVHASNPNRIPAFTKYAPRLGKKDSGESTPQKRPSHGKKVLGGIERTCSGESTPRIGQKSSGGGGMTANCAIMLLE